MAEEIRDRSIIIRLSAGELASLKRQSKRVNIPMSTIARNRIFDSAEQADRREVAKLRAGLDI